MYNYLIRFVMLSFVLANAAYSSEAVEPSTKKVPAVHNLIWIMKDKVGLDDQKLISPDESLLNRAVEWSQTNPELEVDVIYDGSMLDAAHVENSLSFIVEKQAANKVRLMDVRALPIVQAYPTAFLPSIPIALRVDLLRVIKSYDDLATKSLVISSYADIDAEPLSLLKVYEDCDQDLDNYGLVMAREDSCHRKTGYKLKWENGFHVFSAGSHDYLLRALDSVLIQPCINRFRWYSHLSGLDDEFKQVEAYQQLQRWMPTQIKKIKRDDLLDEDVSTDFVYTRIENVVTAYHSLNGRLDCLAVGPQQSLILLNYLLGSACGADTSRPIMLGNQRISLQCVMLNPFYALTIDSNSVKGAVQVFDKPDLQRIHIPTVKIRMPESTILGYQKKDEARTQKIKASFLPEPMKNKAQKTEKKKKNDKKKKK